MLRRRNIFNGKPLAQFEIPNDSTCPSCGSNNILKFRPCDTCSNRLKNLRQVGYDKSIGKIMALDGNPKECNNSACRENYQSSRIVVQKLRCNKCGHVFTSVRRII